MINNVVLTGRLTKDIELRRTTSGKTCTSFTLAVNRNKQETDFINCVAWNDVAESLEKYTKKGSLIGIEGRIQTRSYDDKNGKKVRTTGFYVSSPEDIDILKINKNNFYIKAKKDCMWQNNNLLSDHVYRITFDILDRSSNDGEEYFMSKHDIDKLNDSMNKLASDLKQAVLD